MRWRGLDLAPGVQSVLARRAMDAGRPFDTEHAMQTQQISLKSFEQIAHSRGLGILAVGGLIVAFWLGGHGALYSAYRITRAHAAAVVAEVQ